MERVRRTAGRRNKAAVLLRAAVQGVDRGSNHELLRALQQTMLGALQYRL